MSQHSPSPLYRVDHVKRESYHLVVQKLNNSVDGLFSRVNDLSGSETEVEDKNLPITKYSIAILAQLGFVLDYGESKDNATSREQLILRKFNDKIKIDDQSTVDSSFEIEAEFISKRLHAHCNSIQQSEDNGENIKFLLDCTCSVGGNLIPLTADFYTVGIDISPTRCELCRHNLKVYGLEERSVIVNADANYFLSCIDFDNPDSFTQFGIDVTRHPFDKLLKYGFSCVYISPPWGGANYPGSSDKTVTYRIKDIQSLDLVDAVVKARRFSNFISLLLPKSQSIPDLIHLSNILNLPFITADLLYNRPNSPLPRLCYVHFTTQQMGNPPHVKFKKFNMQWEAPEISDCVDISIPIKYSHDKINLVSAYSVAPGVDLNTSPFSRAVAESVISALDEPMHILARVVDIIESVDMENIQLLLQKTFEIHYSNGMKYTLDGETRTRTFGGIFFYLFKMEYHEIYQRIERKYKAKKRQNSS